MSAKKPMAAHSGGSARGYQSEFALSAAAECCNVRAADPYILCIGALGTNVRFCRVEVRLAVDCAVSAAAGTPEVGLGDRGRGRLVPDHHRCVDSEAGLCCQEFLDSLVDV
jgi:hypothetical protein